MTKQEQRNQIRTLKEALKPEEALRKSKDICRRLLDLPEVIHAKRVFSYQALPGEVDLSCIHEFLKSCGAEIAFPKIHGNGIMQAYFPMTEEAFGTGKFGIREPIPEKSRLADPSSFDLILVPCVGFDAGCKRLGHGAGYYDRYLPKCTGAILLSPAFEFQRLDRVVTDENDIPMDAVVTETEIYSKSGDR